MHTKRFWSETYREFLQFRMTTSAIKKVKACAGGIDQYLLTTSNDVLLYPKAIALKEHIGARPSPKDSSRSSPSASRLQASG